MGPTTEGRKGKRALGEDQEDRGDKRKGWTGRREARVKEESTECSQTSQGCPWGLGWCLAFPPSVPSVCDLVSRSTAHPVWFVRNPETTCKAKRSMLAPALPSFSWSVRELILLLLAEVKRTYYMSPALSKVTFFGLYTYWCLRK